MSEYTPRARHQKGAEAEQLAEEWLLARGLTLMARNYNCRFGEIDLVMSDDNYLVFVEVRSRRSDRFGGALGSINTKKQSRLIRAAQHYLAFVERHTRRPCRFDVVAISASNSKIQWVKNAFAPPD